jgi:predicted GNAT superfamily acetyltransferase
MPIDIRPVQRLEEYRTAEDIQREVWGLADARLTSSDIMIAIHKSGGLVLGAFDTEPAEQPRMVGYLCSFVGLHPNGRVKHASHQLGILPAYQGRNIGYRMKLAQRDYVLAQGIDLITWTYDPLESRNAYLNIHKLGAVCNTYMSNAYGIMRDALNQGLPSDRFQVEWHIASDYVARRLEGQYTSPVPSELQRAQVPLLNADVPASPQAQPHASVPTNHDYLLIEIPQSFQAIKMADMQQAAAWRQQSGLLLETAFVSGYTAIDLLIEGTRRYYLLEKHWSPA